MSEQKSSLGEIMENDHTTNISIDDLVESAAVYGELAVGMRPEWVKARSPRPEMVNVLAHRVKHRRAHPPRWTKEEDEFLRENLGTLSEQEIAKRLGRTRNAIKIRWTRQKMTAAGKRPGYISTRTVAELLGVDNHLPPY